MHGASTNQARVKRNYEHLKNNSIIPLIIHLKYFYNQHPWLYILHAVFAAGVLIRNFQERGPTVNGKDMIIPYTYTYDYSLTVKKKNVYRF